MSLKTIVALVGVTEIVCLDCLQSQDFLFKIFRKTLLIFSCLYSLRRYAAYHKVTGCTIVTCKGKAIKRLAKMKLSFLVPCHSSANWKMLRKT